MIKYTALIATNPTTEICETRTDRGVEEKALNCFFKGNPTIRVQVEGESYYQARKAAERVAEKRQGLLFGLSSDPDMLPVEQD